MTFPPWSDCANDSEGGIFGTGFPKRKLTANKCAVSAFAHCSCYCFWNCLRGGKGTMEFTHTELNFPQFYWATAWKGFSTSWSQCCHTYKKSPTSDRVDWGQTPFGQMGWNSYVAKEMQVPEFRKLKPSLFYIRVNGQPASFEWFPSSSFFVLLWLGKWYLVNPP